MIEKKTRKKEIGQGIRALLNTTESKVANSEERAEAQKVLNSTINEVPLDTITANPWQPRSDWDQEALDELAASIRSLGIIQPITLRAISANSYQLISGERRFRAAKLAGLTAIPAYIRTADDQAMLEMALVENIQRSDLNAIEIAISYQRLIQECNLTHDALSDRVGKDRSTITNYTRLLKLSPDIQDAIRQGRISMGHARCLAGIHDLLLQRQVFRDVIEKSWSVRALEKHLRELEEPKRNRNAEDKPSRIISPALRDIEQQLARHLGSKISLDHKKTGAGRIVIPYRDEEDLHRLLELLQNQ